jgi:hypothetical protein
LAIHGNDTHPFHLILYKQSILAMLEIGRLVIGHLVNRWGGDAYIHDFHLDNRFGARVKPHNE